MLPRVEHPCLSFFLASVSFRHLNMNPLWSLLPHLLSVSIENPSSFSSSLHQKKNPVRDCVVWLWFYLAELAAVPLSPEVKR